MTSQKITAWSISRYQTYLECPRKAFYKFIKGMKEPGSAAMDRGTDIHKKIEDFLSGKTKVVPTEAKSLAKELKEIKKSVPEVELSLAFNSKWETTNWFGNSAWCRVKVDILIPPKVESPVVYLYDNKTGKLKEHGEYDNQLSIYALAGLLSYPIADKVEAGLLFVDHGKEIRGEPVFRKDVKKLQKRWEIMVKPMLSDTKFKPQPGNACRWCHFSKSKGGPCDW